ncbi:MAG: DUF305 domain-containing protein [Rubrobacter sp.]|nr:DUF305 domain-containing protein [Rubrobacter sp.]
MAHEHNVTSTGIGPLYSEDGSFSAHPPLRRLGEPPVLLALVTILLGVIISLVLLLVPQSPGEDSPEVGFTRDMIVHHAQAVEMANIARDRTQDPSIRVLATDILLTQQAEIGQMQGWLDAWALAYTGSEPAMNWMGHPTYGRMLGMASPEEIDRLKQATPKEVDEQFLRLMIPHHQGALPMAQAILELSKRPEVARLAQKIQVSQPTEISGMQAMLERKGLTPVEGQPPSPLVVTEEGFTASLPTTFRDTARLMPLPLAILAAAWLVLGEMYGRQVRAGLTEKHPVPPLGWRIAAAGGLITSAALHIGIAPARFEDPTLTGIPFVSVAGVVVWASTIHGVFFCIAGVATAITAAAILAWPSRRIHLAGACISGMLIVLWAVLRLVPPPGTEAPEAVDLVGSLTKAAELVAMVVCAVLCFWPTRVGRSEYSQPRWGFPLYMAAAFSIVAALIHLWVMPGYFNNWWGYGVSFLTVFLAQGLYGVALLIWGSQRLLFLVGIAGNFLIIVIYVTAHNVGIPLLGPYAGEVQAGGAIDLGAMAAELAVVVTLMTQMQAYESPVGDDGSTREDNS